MIFRKKQSDDQSTDSLVQRGVFRLPDVYKDEEGKEFKNAKVAYSFWSAVKYTFFLSVLLWWLPIFGQMIAGYVGGRRAGTPWKGVLAALIPVIAIFGIMTGIEMGIIPTIIFGIDLSPGAIMGYIAAHLPLIEPYFNFTVMYVESFLDALQATTSLSLDSYIITVAFAYIGGILSDQTRREMEFVTKYGGPKTTVVVEGNASPREASSYVPSWSQQFFPSKSNTRGPLSFEEMQAMEGYSNDEERARERIRAARHEEDMDIEMTPREREFLKKKAKLMEKNQKKMDKKINSDKGIPILRKLTSLGRGSSDESSSRRGESGERQSRNQRQETRGDWEFI